MFSGSEHLITSPILAEVVTSFSVHVEARESRKSFFMQNQALHLLILFIFAQMPKTLYVQDDNPNVSAPTSNYILEEPSTLQDIHKRHKVSTSLPLVPWSSTIPRLPVVLLVNTLALAMPRGAWRIPVWLAGIRIAPTGATLRQCAPTAAAAVVLTAVRSVGAG